MVVAFRKAIVAVVLTSRLIVAEVARRLVTVIDPVVTRLVSLVILIALTCSPAEIDGLKIMIPFSLGFFALQTDASRARENKTVSAMCCRICIIPDSYLLCDGSRCGRRLKRSETCLTKP